MFLVDSLKFPNQPIFLAKGLDNPHAFNGLGQLDIDIAELTSGHHDQMIGQLAIETNGPPDDGQERQDKEGQLPVELEHDNEGGCKNEERRNKTSKDRPKHISHSLSIIGDPRHDGAGRRFVKISHPQLLDVGKGFLPHIADDAVCHSGESIASQIGKEDPQQEEQVIG